MIERSRKKKRLRERETSTDQLTKIFSPFLPPRAQQTPSRPPSLHDASHRSISQPPTDPSPHLRYPRIETLTVKSLCEAEALDLVKTGLETVEEAAEAENLRLDDIKGLLGWCNFKSNVLDRKVLLLSGGEKAAMDDYQRKKLPSISAMALMGKATNCFLPCQFRKKSMTKKHFWLTLKTNKPQTEFFCKTLTTSDTSTHGGFSVP